MDAEAYPEASRNVLQILWGICASAHPQGNSKWSKARASAFDALYHYEVSLCFDHKCICSVIPVLLGISY